jgi:tetratricopeptide (TPR) repeat protein
MSSQTAYRYPGSRPFEDTDIDRKLFFGRDREKEEFLHKVLVKKLVVLYARSGLGKTSLINAGVSLLLRENGCLPLKVRFNDAGTDPVRTVYDTINNTVRELHLDVDTGEEKTLWQYFKTAAFWSAGASDALMTPVLILDPFEEFFVCHEPEARKAFISQLSHLVYGTIPSGLRQSIAEGEPFPYGEDPPDVKIVISIREDYLGLLDELSADIPDILHSRYRLLALTREQAGEAIVKPPQIEDGHIHGTGFRYAQDTVNTMLDYLGKGKEKSGAVMKDEVESFQLQLLCRHIEINIIPKRVRETGAGHIVVKKEDLGGEAGMHKVLQNFYENQLSGFKTFPGKRRVRRLCEKGLISPSNRRLSREEEEIQRQFKISPATLARLVDLRLLRAEARVGSVYYELSHDTLVTPIRLSQRKRRATFNKYAIFILIPLFFVVITLFLLPWGESARQEKINILFSRAQEFAFDSNYDAAIENYNKALELNPGNPYTYNYLGIAFQKKGEPDTAVAYFKKALEFDPGFNLAHVNIGNVFTETGRFDEAKAWYRKAIRLNPGFAPAYKNLGVAFQDSGRYDEAIENYREAIELDPGYADAYRHLGLAFRRKGDYDTAIENYREALQLKPDDAETYFNMGIAFQFKGDDERAIEIYRKVLKIKPGYPGVKPNLTELYFLREHFAKAAEMAKEVLKEKNILICNAVAMRLISISALYMQGNAPLARKELKEFIAYYRCFTGEYRKCWDYSLIKTFITRTQRLNEQSRNILLKLIDLLESPRRKGEPLLEELETLIRQQS